MPWINFVFSWCKLSTADNLTVKTWRLTGDSAAYFARTLQLAVDDGFNLFVHRDDFAAWHFCPLNPREVNVMLWYYVRRSRIVLLRST